jgi:hypothetical protein
MAKTGIVSSRKTESIPNTDVRYRTYLGHYKRLAKIYFGEHLKRHERIKLKAVADKGWFFMYGSTFCLTPEGLALVERLMDEIPFIFTWDGFSIREKKQHEKEFGRRG